MSANKDKKNKFLKKLNKRTKFTMFAMFNIVWYAIAVLIASFNDHHVPDSLTVAWFSAWTVELALLFGIKLKSRNDSSNNNYQYDSYSDNNYSDNIATNDDYCIQDENNVSDYDSGLG